MNNTSATQVDPAVFRQNLSVFPWLHNHGSRITPVAEPDLRAVRRTP